MFVLQPEVTFHCITTTGVLLMHSSLILRCSSHIFIHRPWPCFIEKLCEYNAVVIGLQKYLYNTQLLRTFLDGFSLRQHLSWETVVVYANWLLFVHGAQLIYKLFLDIFSAFLWPQLLSSFELSVSIKLFGVVCIFSMSSLHITVYIDGERYIIYTHYYTCMCLLLCWYLYSCLPIGQ